MSERLIKIYKQLDIHKIQEQLLVWGELSGHCAHCSAMGLKMEMPHCPQCRTTFKYIAFRNIKDHLPKVHKIIRDRADLMIVDYDDFKRVSGALKAEEFLK